MPKLLEKILVFMAAIIPILISSYFFLKFSNISDAIQAISKNKAYNIELNIKSYLSNSLTDFFDSSKLITSESNVSKVLQASDENWDYRLDVNVPAYFNNTFIGSLASFDLISVRDAQVSSLRGLSELDEVSARTIENSINISNQQPADDSTFGGLSTTDFLRSNANEVFSNGILTFDNSSSLKFDNISTNTFLRVDSENNLVGYQILPGLNIEFITSATSLTLNVPTQATAEIRIYKSLAASSLFLGGSSFDSEFLLLSNVSDLNKLYTLSGSLLTNTSLISLFPQIDTNATDDITTSNLISSLLTLIPNLDTNAQDDITNFNFSSTLFTLFPNIDTNASDDIGILQEAVLIGSEAGKNVYSENLWFGYQNFNRASASLFEVENNGKILLNGGVLPANVDNSVYNYDDVLYFQENPIATLEDYNLPSYNNKFAFFKTDASGKIQLVGASDIDVDNLFTALSLSASDITLALGFTPLKNTSDTMSGSLTILQTLTSQDVTVLNNLLIGDYANSNYLLQIEPKIGTLSRKLVLDLTAGSQTQTTLGMYIQSVKFSAPTDSELKNLTFNQISSSNDLTLDILKAGTLPVVSNGVLDTLNSRVSAPSAVFTGNISAATAYINGYFSAGSASLGAATINGNLSAALGAFTQLGVSGDFSAANGTFTGNLSAATAYINGYFSAGSASLGATKVNSLQVSDSLLLGCCRAGSGFIDRNPSYLAIVSGFSEPNKGLVLGIGNTFTWQGVLEINTLGQTIVNGYFSAASATLASTLIRGNLTVSNPSGTSIMDFYANGASGDNIMIRSRFGNNTLAQINQDFTNTLEIENYAVNGNTHLNFPNGGNLRAYISGGLEFELSSTSLNLNSNNLINVGTAYAGYLQAADWAYAGNGYYTGNFYSWINDQDTYINRLAENTVQVQTGNIQRLEIGPNTTSVRNTLSANVLNIVNSLDVADNRTLCTQDGNRVVELKNGACGTSSIRYKENVATLPYGLTEIMRLNPVEYNFKGFTKENSGGRTKERLGFIAEEMNKIIPEVVLINEKGLVDSIEYSDLVPLAIKGIQEQQIQIQNLSEAIGSINLDSFQSNYDDFKSALNSLSLSTQAGSLIVNSGLTVTGSTLLNEVSITGNITSGQIKIDSLENDISIDTAPCIDLEGDLKETDCTTNQLNIMKNKSGNVTMFDGKVRFKPDGEVLGEKVQAKTFKNNNTSTPSNSSSCSTGEFKFAEDGGKSFIYYCNSNSNWTRAELSSF